MFITEINVNILVNYMFIHIIINNVYGLLKYSIVKLISSKHMNNSTLGKPVEIITKDIWSMPIVYDHLE